MKKSVFGRKLKRDKNERTALFKGLISALVLSERIETTKAKAKAIKPEIDKLVTKAKKGGNTSKRLIQASLSSQALDKFVNNIAPRFTDRKGGYTRIIRIGNRLGDEADMVILEWTEGPREVVVIDNKPKVKSAPVKTKSSAKKAVKKTSPKVTKTKKSTAKSK